MVIDGIEAAQALFPRIPTLLITRHCTIDDNIVTLTTGKPATSENIACQPKTSDEARFIARVRAALASKDLFTLNRLLDAGPTPTAEHKQEIVDRVVEAKFRHKADGEMDGGAAEEVQWWKKWSTCCGDDKPKLAAADVVSWARRRRKKAGDVGGWNGSLILDLVKVRADVARVLAEIWSMDPLEWRSRSGALLMWRVLRCVLIPQNKPLPRPVAVASCARRAWGAKVAKELQKHAAAYCEARGQYGMSKADGAGAYILGARVFIGLGGDVVFDDRANSFHELHRRAVFDAVGRFIESMPKETKEKEGAHLLDMVRRTFVGGMEDGGDQWLRRSAYTMPHRHPLIHSALCQGSSESSILEALTYARTDDRFSDGVRVQFHDDGYRAILPSAPLELLRRSLPDDGSTIADGKDFVVGPRAHDAAQAGLAKQAATSVLIAGVPVGNVQEGLQRWRHRYSTKVRRLREIADWDVAVAAGAAAAVGGPAGLAAHILRSTSPNGHEDFWKSVDDEWVDMWLHFLKLPDVTDCTRRNIRYRIFATGHNSLGQVAASDVAHQRYAEGIQSSAVKLEALLARGGVTMGPDVWKALDVDQWRDKPGLEWTGDSLAAVARRRVTLVTAKRDEDDQRRKRTLEDANLLPRRALPTTNLFCAWLRSTEPIRLRGAVIALRALFHLPVLVPQVGLVPPRTCSRCGATPPSGRAARAVKGPRSQVDDFGEHALACIGSKGEIQRRHNDIAYAIRDVICEAGLRANCATGRVFDTHRGRPADVWVEDHPAHRSGLAIDCTIVSTVGRTSGAAADDAEKRKMDKYKDEVAKHPGLGFAPFAIDFRGDVGASAWMLIHDWARLQSVDPNSTRNFPESLAWVCSTIANAFVSGFIRHILLFDAWQREGGVPMGTRGRGPDRFRTDTTQRKITDVLRSTTGTQNSGLQHESSTDDSDGRIE
jgi:hypothetical protein